MTDNLALSFILLIIEGMARNHDASTENDHQHGSSRPQRTPTPVGISSALDGDVEMVGNDDPSAEALSLPLTAPLPERVRLGVKHDTQGQSRFGKLRRLSDPSRLPFFGKGPSLFFGTWFLQHRLIDDVVADEKG
ncbi:MAG: hypothetical protein JWQ65_410 [Devosia sp.]|nr:hypothetical protein [Devosia sp.]